MARKDSESTPEHHGFNDVVGVVLLGLALLLFIAMASFDRYDIKATTTMPNVFAHNWIGRAGAWIAHYFFQAFGAAAFVIPVLSLLFGFSCFFNTLHYLRRRWAWGLVLFFCCVGFLSLFTNERVLSQLNQNPNLANAGFLEHVSRNLGTASAGGVAGVWLNQVFGNFGRPGASIIYITLYAVSLLFLTNFRLGEWVRGLFEKTPEGEEEMSPEERALDRKARDLAKQAQKLQEQVEKGRVKAEKADKTSDKPEKPGRGDKLEREEETERVGLGADLQPVPEPTVRDLSLSKPSKAGKKPAPEMEHVVEGEVISQAQELIAKGGHKVLEFGVADETAWRVGLACGGRIKIYVEAVA